MRHVPATKLLLLACVLLLVGVLSSVISRWLFAWGSDPTPLGHSLAAADPVIVWEGLPHPFYERDELEQELHAKETITIHDFPFYQDTQRLTKLDGTVLARIFADAEAFRPIGWEFLGGTGCGGYHPHFCLQGQGDDGIYQVQICFGCLEVRGFGPRMQVKAAVAVEALDAMRKVLRKYRKNRPMTEPWKWHVQVDGD